MWTYADTIPKVLYKKIREELKIITKNKKNKTHGAEELIESLRLLADPVLFLNAVSSTHMPVDIVTPAPRNWWSSSVFGGQQYIHLHTHIH